MDSRLRVKAPDMRGESGSTESHPVSCMSFDLTQDSSPLFHSLVKQTGSNWLLLLEIDPLPRGTSVPTHTYSLSHSYANKHSLT